MMEGYELNFAFKDGDLELCEELRQKGEKLEFSHNDILQALWDGRYDIILWLEKWYPEQWQHYCKNYYPLPNAIMGGNIDLVNHIWRMAEQQPEHEKWFDDITLLGPQRPLYYAVRCGKHEMVEWVENKYPKDKVDERILLECVWDGKDELALWLLKNREFSVSQESADAADCEDNFCPLVLEELRKRGFE